MSKLESPLQREILSALSFHAKGAKYSQLNVAKLENDLFNYHLQQLVKYGYVVKVGDLYQLTENGKSLVTNIDEIDKQLPPNYKVSVYMCLIDGQQILLYKRLKHPQYGYTGLPSGKIKYGEPILETAKRELLEKTGLSANFQIIGNLRQIRKNKDGQTIEDGVFYICFANNYTGKLTPDLKEGEFYWCDIDKAAHEKKIFKPSLEIVVSEIQTRLSKQVPWTHQFIYELTPDPEEY